MTTLLDAAKAALTALENLEGIDTERECVTVDVGTEIEDLRAAIAVAERQEPVGHKKVIDLEENARPFATIEQHDDELVKRWNETVRQNDTVWHLGDVLFGEAAFQTLGRLNGIKKLVMGNHDHYPTAKYLEHFNVVLGSVKTRGVLLTHVPVHPNQLYRFQANIHGHMHSHTVGDPRYVCVSAEQTDLRPVLLDTVIHKALQGQNP